MDRVTVQETFFWREMDQVRALVDELVPRHHEEHPGETIRVWSAACATGEEPLTLAMALNEAGWLDRAQIEIVASDASPAALEKAKRGVYRDHSFRNLPVELKAKYFTPEGDDWRIDPSLAAHVRWQRTNLLDSDTVSQHEPAPFIFCRNVFIYFSKDSIRKAVELLLGRLSPPGHLFVGASESLLKVTTKLDLEEIAGAYVYVRRPE